MDIVSAVGLALFLGVCIGSHFSFTSTVGREEDK